MTQGVISAESSNLFGIYVPAYLGLRTTTPHQYKRVHDSWTTSGVLLVYLVQMRGGRDRVQIGGLLMLSRG